MTTQRLAIVGAGCSLININSSYFTDCKVWATPRAAILLRDKGYSVDQVIHQDCIDMKMKVLRRDLRYMHTTPDFEKLHLQMTSAWDSIFRPSTFLRLPKLPEVKYPHMIELPLALITDYFNSDFIVDSASLALAYAMYLRYENIDLHGIDFLPDSRNQARVEQSECFGYWMGRAVERGIKFRINPASRVNSQFHFTQRGHRSKGYDVETLKTLPTTNLQKLENFYVNKSWQDKVMLEQAKIAADERNNEEKGTLFTVDLSSLPQLKSLVE